MADQAFAVALDLLPLVSDRRATWDSRQHQLGRLQGLAQDAAAVALRLGDPPRALMILEQARAVLIGQALDTRADSYTLRPCHPELADDFDRLRELLNADTIPSAESDADLISMGDPARWRRDAAREFDRLLTSIREIPEHAEFLRRPTATDLIRCAGDGSIAVINVSRYGCDALLVHDDAIRAMPLPDLRATDATDRANAVLTACDANDWTTNAVVVSTLEWLATTVVRPILTNLYGDTPLAATPHIWWLPTGPLALLPLHAAGDAPERVVSSYASTIRSLDRARSAPAASGRALVVGITASHELPQLAQAAEEAELVVHHLPTADRPILDGAATWETVAQRLTDVAWAHFACHALTDIGDPSASSLLLADRPLLVREVLATEAKIRHLAYLSACSTVASPGRLVDEAIHVGSAFHLAGFRHVLGTLWRVSDAISMDLAAAIYPALAKGTEPAVALHAATAALRHRYPANPLLWAAHIHIGP